MWKIGSFVDKWIFKKGVRLIKVIGCGKEVVISGKFLSEYCSEKMWHFATFCMWPFKVISIKKRIALLRLVFDYVFFLSHQLRLVLNIYEGVLVVVHGEAESNRPEWWATAVWLFHCPLFSWILGRRFEIYWTFVIYWNVSNNKSPYILVGSNFLFQSNKSVFHLHFFLKWSVIFQFLIAVGRSLSRARRCFLYTLQIRDVIHAPSPTSKKRKENWNKKQNKLFPYLIF